MNSPADVAKNYLDIGTAKAGYPIRKMLLLGVLAGMYIAFAAVASATATVSITSASVAKMVGALLFPAGLAMVLIAGSELFTGNCLIIIPVLEKRVSASAMLRNWLFVYLGNFIGSLLVAAAVVFGHTYSLFGNALGGYVISTAVAKVSLSFGDALIRGILCNILVCVAVWMSFAAKTVTCKIAGLYFPVFLFVISGFEHCIANMYYISGGILAASNPQYLAAYGADAAGLNWGSMLINNLLPVTIGNIIGGAFIVGAGYWLIYLKSDSKTPSHNR